ncbi:antibiotic biosynthesis monooxygenase family protein [Antarctobacter jejuensis]|uniref:antibiotic biosynthesis monooxygenase family protein n=1 Tax=Antarctobacter jejuensis TaxID=1439938 RepID=UPI003FD180B7
MHGLFFNVRPKPGHLDHYFAHVERLKPVLARHDGLLYLERFRALDDPDELLSHQHWRDDDAIRAWREDPEHKISQAAGRRIHFDSYHLRIGPELTDETPATRLLVALYGAAPAKQGRAFESVTTPGRFVTLIDAASAEEARSLTTGADTARIFAITRDYTHTDRAEAPDQQTRA